MIIIYLYSTLPKDISGQNIEAIVAERNPVKTHTPIGQQEKGCIKRDLIPFD